MKLNGVYAEETQLPVQQDADQRYTDFIEKVVEAETLWALFDDGWALAVSEKKEQLFLLFSTEEEALVSAVDALEAYTPAPIDLHDFLASFLDSIYQEGLKLGIFYGSHNKIIVIEKENFRADLAQELSRIG